MHLIWLTHTIIEKEFLIMKVAVIGANGRVGQLIVKEQSKNN